MERTENASQVENATSVISLLSVLKKPGARITFLAAHKALHLGIRTQPSGSQKYVVVRRPAGSTKLAVVTLCDAARGEKEALKLARAVNADMDRGVNPNEKKKASREAERKEQLKAKHSFLSVGESYIERLKRRGRSEITVEQFGRMLNCADLAPWHARPISDIGIEEVEAMLAKVRDRAPMRAVRLYGFLRSMLGYALKARILASDPLQHFDKAEHLDKEKPRKRTLIDPYTGNADELLAIWRGVEELEANHPARALVKLLCLTGLRVGTLARTHKADALLWRHVKDLDKPELARLEIPWELRKTGEEGDGVQIVPLVPAAVTVLGSLAKVSEDAPVFTLDGKTSLRADYHLRDSLRAMADRAAGRELPHWVLHDLRRSVATGLGFLGCPPAIIDEILDHAGEAKQGIRGVYDLSARVGLRRQWLQRWADQLGRQAGRRPGDRR